MITTNRYHSISTNNDNYFNGTKIAPDSNYLLTITPKLLQLFQLSNLKLINNFSHGLYISDFEWWPLMDNNIPSTCCFASLSKHLPVHLFDALSGSLCSSYSPMNSLDQIDHSFSITFNNDGEKLLVGADSGFYAFLTRRPGRDSTFFRTKKCRRDIYGQRGIISTLAVRPTGYEDTIAAGSFSGTVGIYSLNEADAVGTFNAHTHGVTHIKFSPCGTYLFTGGRMQNDVRQWDLRMLGTTYPKPTKVFYRQVLTNQRIRFDVDGSGRFLVTGSTCGSALVYDLHKPSSYEDEIIQPYAMTSRSNSSANSASFNPALVNSKTCFAYTTGERPRLLGEGFDSDSDSPYGDMLVENSLESMVAICAF